MSYKKCQTHLALFSLEKTRFREILSMFINT